MFGLDISDHSIEVVQMSSRNRVKRFGRVLLTEGIVKDGLITNKEVLVEGIKKVLIKSKIRARKVFVSIPESKAFVHVFEDKKNIEEESKKTIPWEPKEVYFDVYKTAYVAVPKNIIDSYAEVIKSSGLKLIGFDIESLALARSLEAKNSLIIDIGARTTNLTVFDKKEQVKITINIAKGGDMFTRAISKSLKVDLKEAEKLKISNGLDIAKDGGKIMLILQKEFELIIRQARKAKALYGENVEQIILVGGSAQMPKIADYFSSNLGLRTSLGKSKLMKKPILYGVAIGLALKKYEEGIVITPKIKSEVKSFNKKWLVIPFMIIASLILAFVVFKYIVDPILNPPVVDPIVPVEIEEIVEEVEEVIEIVEKVSMVVVKETPTGWLRVRKSPGTSYEVIKKVYPGDSFPLLGEEKGWYNIQIEEEASGWVFSSYVNIIK